MSEDPKAIQAHLAMIEAKMVEVRDELEGEDRDYRIVPLTFQDSGVVLAICESIGVDLVPLGPIGGSLFLVREQLDQLFAAMDEFRKPFGKESA